MVRWWVCFNHSRSGYESHTHIYIGLKSGEERVEEMGWSEQFHFETLMNGSMDDGMDRKGW